MTNAKNKKKSSSVKKLIPAVGMLMISATMLATSTYAWFTMNTEVEATGMTVHTTVDSNLLIAGDSLTSNVKLDDNKFTTVTLTQSLKKILEPVSTGDGTTFYYTVNAYANGDAVTEEYTQYSSNAEATTTDYANKFSEDYGLTKTEAAALVDTETGAVPYVDYVFQLKADNTSDSVQYINLTKLDMTYTKDESETDSQKAYRVAIFVEDITSGTVTAGVGTLKGVWKPEGASNFTDTTKTVDSESTVTGNLTYISSATPLATVSANSTSYYKVVVRLYIEGEDTTCYSANFKDLVGSWALNLGCKLETTSTNGVTAITLS